MRANDGILAPEERVLALVASFTAEKGHALLLEAFAELQTSAFRGRWPRCRLLLAGDGVLRAAWNGKRRRCALRNR